jgi:hypothetical protein
MDAVPDRKDAGGEALPRQAGEPVFVLLGYGATMLKRRK